MRAQIKVSDTQYVVVADPIEDDYDNVLRALEIAIEDSPYSQPDSPESVLDMFWGTDWTQRILFLAYNNNEVVGLLAGVYSPHIIHQDKKQASEMVWWVREDMRKGSLGLELLKAFEEWATLLDANYINLSHYHRDPIIGKLYQRRGYTPMEVTYTKEIY